MYVVHCSPESLSNPTLLLNICNQLKYLYKKLESRYRNIQIQKTTINIQHNIIPRYHPKIKKKCARTFIDPYILYIHNENRIAYLPLTYYLG